MVQQTLLMLLHHAGLSDRSQGFNAMLHIYLYSCPYLFNEEMQMLVGDKAENANKGRACSAGVEAFAAGGIELHQRLLSGLYLPLVNPID